MKSIFASKLYIASSRQGAIRAALFNSNNAGLVTQLAESLDEEYQKAEYLKKKDSEPSDVNVDDSAEDADGESSSKARSSSSKLPAGLNPHMDMGSFNPESDLVAYPEGDEGNIDADLPDSDGSEPLEDVPNDNSAEPQDVKESTAIKSSTITDPTIPLTVLKNSLNLVDNMKGVSRITQKENELWIYYDGDINLNNIMTDVIEFVIQCYPVMEFNRLARSDNAIVFEILKSAC